MLKEIQTDVAFTLQDIDNVFIGKPFRVTVDIVNNSNEVRIVLYIGRTKKEIRQFSRAAEVGLRLSMHSALSRTTVETQTWYVKL